MKRSDRILQEIAAKHNLSVKMIIGRERWPHLVAVRREAMTAMKAVGMTHSIIAAATNRHRTTVLQYINQEYAARKNLYRTSPELYSHAQTYWSHAQVRLFTDLYATVPNAELAVEFGRTLHAIEGMARRLGLRKAKRGRPPKLRSGHSAELRMAA